MMLSYTRQWEKKGKGSTLPFDYVLRIPAGDGGYYGAGIQDRKEEGFYWMVDRHGANEAVYCTQEVSNLETAKRQAEDVIREWHRASELNWSEPGGNPLGRGVTAPGKAL